MKKLKWIKMRGYLFFLILLNVAFLFASICQAQPEDLNRFKITPITPHSDGIPVFRDHPDKAGIIIESPITNLAFSSNMDGIVDQRSEPARGRYVLIIEPFTQIIVVDAPGYIQGRFRVGSPNARDIHYYEIHAEEREPNLISVFFDIEPRDAKLFVDDQQVEINQTIQLPPGSSEIRLEREGYKTFQTVTMITSKNIMFNYELDEVDIVPVHFVTKPAGASVFIDNLERGQTDGSGVFGLFLYPGEYVVSIQASGYMSQSEDIIVSENDDNRFEFTLNSNIGELALKVTPSDAQILINREDYSGETNIKLIPGRYRLDIKKDGHAPYSEQIEIAIDDLISRNIELVPYTGNLQFEVSPGNANVTLHDSKGNIVREWQGLEYIRDIPVGNYRIRAYYNGHNDWIHEIQLSKDQTKKVDAKLEKVFYGSLQINTYDLLSNGALFRDGVEIKSWKGSAYFEELPLGQYKIIYPAIENYSSWEKEIILDSSLITIDVKRKKSREYKERRLQKFLGYVIIFAGSVLITVDNTI